MGAFFRALSSEHIKGALPASDIYVEFYIPGTEAHEERFLQEVPLNVDASNIMVRIFFNDTYYRHGEILDVKQSRSPMTLAEFQTLITTTLDSFQFKTSVADPTVCGNTNFQFNQTFYPGDEWRQQMIDIYGLMKGVSNIVLGSAVFGTALLAFI